MPRFALVFACACDVYGPSLLTGDGGADVDASAKRARRRAAARASICRSTRTTAARAARRARRDAAAVCARRRVLTDGLGAPHGLLSTRRVALRREPREHQRASDEQDRRDRSQEFRDRRSSSPIASPPTRTNLFWTNVANVSQIPGGGIQYGNFDGRRSARSRTSSFVFDAELAVAVRFRHFKARTCS